MKVVTFKNFYLYNSILVERQSNSKMNIIFSDLDGTLLNSQHKVSIPQLSFSVDMSRIFPWVFASFMPFFLIENLQILCYNTFDTIVMQEKCLWIKAIFRNLMIYT